MKKTIFWLLLITIPTMSFAQNHYISQDIIQKTTSQIQKESKIPISLISLGVSQTANLWMEEDGTPEEFTEFCKANFCANAQDKEHLFQRLCDNFETLLGHANRIAIDLSAPIQVSGYESLSIDERFAAYDANAHMADDMFANKIAFIITLNFPHYTLTEKADNAAKWSDLEWGYARLGDLFTSRVPAPVQQNIAAAAAAADNYISNYNIYMGNVKSNDGKVFWSKDLKLISHWGLRDELKACYADKEHGLEKQKLIYSIMTHIIDQTIPRDVINGKEYIWYASANRTFKNTTEFILPREKDVRYEHLLNNFRAIRASDAYYPGESTYLERRFNNDLEFFQNDIERLFDAFLSSPEVKVVADLVAKKLGRKLQPFDIWYNGFRNRNSVEEKQLDAITRQKYPTREAFSNDLPHILQELGFTKEKAEFICSHVTVDASVGAGHAWESMMRSDNARLRTRVGEEGMDYKGYNIGIHEFGHNVEQTFSLHNVPNYFLAGVPNTAFTEALAFNFQNRDLQLLGLTQVDTMARYYDILDNFWSTYEIMGVSLVDIHVWEWMYAHPDATAAELKDAVMTIAKEIWNKYYAPIFKVKDQTILAVYSHMIDSPLYLTAYPLGYLIEFQLGSYFQNKNLGVEVERIFSQGKLIPQYWLQKAVGSKLTATPFIKSAVDAAHKVSDYETEMKKRERKGE